MTKRKLSVLAALATAIVAVVVATASGGGVAPIEPQVVDDATLKALSTTEGGADVLPTTRTVAHWFGQTTDPNNGVTYGYNMVGSNPNACSGAACSTTIEADITPIIVHVGGWTFDGTSVVGATLASPQFANNDYGSTPAATAAGSFPNSPAFIRGPGGLLSQADSGVQQQLQDATMRAQFNKTGKKSAYHLLLHPNVLPAVTIDVPSNQGTVIASGRGVVAADINISWWSSQINNLEQSADPTHLPLYLTNQVLLFQGSPGNCCVIGYHGTRAAGYGAGSANSNGNAVVQTFAWASWVQPGFYARPAGGTDWALQDIHALSHEIAEWADDPFVNNTVEPWVTPTAPQYGCTGVLETGDPVVGVWFPLAGNNAGATDSYNYYGQYHPEEEVFAQWFGRGGVEAAGYHSWDGRLTFMGPRTIALGGPYAGFGTYAKGC
jgi:hypothetical protein